MDDDLNQRPAGSPPPLPGWLKALLVVGLVVLLVAVALTVLGGVSHGPWMHGAG